MAERTFVGARLVTPLPVWGCMVPHGKLPIPPCLAAVVLPMRKIRSYPEMLGIWCFSIHHTRCSWLGI